MKTIEMWWWWWWWFRKTSGMWWWLVEEIYRILWPSNFYYEKMNIYPIVQPKMHQ